ncbi:DNA-directed RNA polymerase [Caulobacter phage DCM]|uniref:DNA-directed RNA polymerase n=1 Tax=Caulobacter phage DCM TaxID=3020391 RepID=A0AAF0B8F7_9CAUD|nr:DNA-directed RNA polymerase [Caulobacter phage DCM]WCD56114.1 DNA-directed RNA polymerase [Caulobacter phage BL199]
MLTQAELEAEMYAHGRHRAERMMSRNEDAGSANNNPYAPAIYRRFVLPLAELIREDIETKRPGRRKAHAVLLEAMNAEAVAYLAVRNVLNLMLMQANDKITARQVASAVGKAVYHELMLSLFSEAEPDLFYTLVNDLGRRMSKSERHRMTVFKMQAKEAGVPFPEWGVAGVEQVGAYLLDQLEELGMLTTWMVVVPGSGRAKPKKVVDIRLTDELNELIGAIKGNIIECTPYFLPCVEPPRDWTAVNNGGFHTKDMRRMQPYAVRSWGGWSEYADHDMRMPLAAINALQRTAWRINKPMLDTIRDVARHFDMDEILSQAEYPAPPRPEWLDGDLKFDQMTEAQQEEFIRWKREKSEWFTQMKLRGTKYGRFYAATTIAEKFSTYPAIYFVYFADFRGRLYAQTTGVSPQGSDMQKALIHFAQGKPLDSLEAEQWFKIHGANKWGYDKASLEDRAKWVDDRHDLIMAFAENPIDNQGWTEADCPLQFLAWAMEYRSWMTSPHTFCSHIPVGLDGSCNGLQNFSAMLRDEVGGRATNLVPSALPNDIYQMVANVTALKLRQVEPDERGFRDKWLKHGMNRSLVKRSVMTLPYGSTRFSCADFIVGDYLKAGKATEFEKSEYQAAAQYLSHFVWDAIGEVVVKAREAMAWLQSSTKAILANHDRITWTAPSGFPVFQQYVEQEMHRINTHLNGNAKIKITVDGEKADKSRHKNGVAPNFIHSYDAAHMTETTCAASAEGMCLAMIHDDYGTHAADTARLFRLIREVFVSIYERVDPLVEFAAAYGLKTEPPARGSLDLRLVLESPYFFS